MAQHADLHSRYLDGTRGKRERKRFLLQEEKEKTKLECERKKMQGEAQTEKARELL